MSGDAASPRPGRPRWWALLGAGRAGLAAVGAALLLTLGDAVLGARPLPMRIPPGAFPWLLLVNSAFLPLVTAPFLLGFLGSRLSTRRPRTASVLAAALLLTPVFWLLVAPVFRGPWISKTVLGFLGTPLTTALCVAVAAGAVLLSRPASGVRDRHALPVLGSALTLSYLLHYKFVPGGPFSGVEAASALLVLVLALAFFMRLVSRRVPRAIAALGVLGLVTPVFVLGRPPPDLAPKLLAGDVVAGTIYRTAAGLDLDGDGYSRLFRNGDCNDLDARTHILAVDVPNDGIDQDCWDGDLTQPAAREYPPIPISFGPPVSKVLLVSVDSLRMDKFAAYMAAGRAPPALARAWNQACFAGPAYAAGPNTRATFRRLLWPQGGAPSWGELARAAGIASTLVTPARVVRRLEVVMPLQQATSRVVPVADGRANTLSAMAAPKSRPTARAVTAAALAQLEQGPARHIVWAHYLDLHERNFLRPTDEPRLKGLVDEPSAERRYELVMAYELDEVGRLLQRAYEIAPSMAVVFFADHGAYFAINKAEWTGYLTIERLISVPLAVGRADGRCEGWPPPAQLAHRLTHYHLGRMILGLVGVEPPPSYPHPGAPPISFGGYDASPSDWQTSRRTVIDWPWKLTVSPRWSGVELFNLETDPGETTDLSAHHKDRARQLMHQLVRTLGQQGADRPSRRR